MKPIEMTMETAKERMTADDQSLQKEQAQTFLRNEKGDGRVEECNQRKNRPEPGLDGQEDRFTLHHGNPRMPDALKVSFTVAQAI